MKRWRQQVGPGLLAITMVMAAVAPSSGQEYEGRVIDATSGDPIVGAVVEIPSQALVTVSGVGGAFVFQNLRQQPDSVIVSRYGYETLRVAVDLSAVRASTFELKVDPVLLEGVATEALSFGERMAQLEVALDARVGEWPGTARVAGVEDLRPFDEEWESDHWKFLHYGPLKVSWQFNQDPMNYEDRVYVRGHGVVKPEVFLDDRQIWMEAFLNIPNESLCRVETYVTWEKPGWTRWTPGPPAQLRAYTCSFMARVAIGEEEICPVLQWGRLISGPEDPASDMRLDRRGAARPANALTPIDLGGGINLSTAATGVGSGACL